MPGDKDAGDPEPLNVPVADAAPTKALARVMC